MTIYIDDFQKVCLSFANNLYIDTPKDKRKYMIHLDFIGECGELLYALNGSAKSAVPGVKLDSNAREIRA